MQTVLIAGGTGFVGKHLVALLLQQGFAVHILSRNKHAAQKNTANTRFFYWNPETGEYDAAAFAGAEYLVNLGGAGVADKRWTPAYKQQIISSRTQSIQLLAKALDNTPNNIRTVVSASATGWYGSDTEASVSRGGFTETDAPADTFFGHTCKQWEEAADLFRTNGKRLTILRIGIVLHPDGGMLKEILKPLRFGLAPVLGRKNRMLSWIKMEDMCRLIVYALQEKKVEGVYNAVAPQPATNGAIVTAIARKFRKFFIKMPVPAFMIKLIAGEFSNELLNSVTVSSKKIQEAGFSFLYHDIENAFRRN